MKSPLRVLLEQAAHDLEKYSFPDIENAEDALRQVILGAENFDIEDGWLLSIEEVNDVFYVKVVRHRGGYRNYEAADEIGIPSWIIDADDPVKTAKIYGLKRQIQERIDRRERIHDTLKILDDEIVDLEGSLYNLENPGYH